MVHVSNTIKLKFEMNVRPDTFPGCDWCTKPLKMAGETINEPIPMLKIIEIFKTGKVYRNTTLGALVKTIPIRSCYFMLTN